jgi:hypothetical protein
MKINVDETDLEKTLKSDKKEDKGKKECKCKDDGSECKCETNSNEEIGFHKGCLNTLVGERNELIKMIQTVEAIMQAHVKKLQELGVKIEAGKKE